LAHRLLCRLWKICFIKWLHYLGVKCRPKEFNDMSS
jgi:hypothetical protein